MLSRTFNIVLRGSRAQNYRVLATGLHTSSFTLQETAKKTTIENEAKIPEETSKSTDDILNELKNAEETITEPVVETPEPVHEVFKPEFQGSSKTASFQADTSNLLKIVAQSLYSDAEVFVREFVSNSSDAIEKSKANGLDVEYMISVNTDKSANTITFTDNGVGMSEFDVNDLLGTIAKSGSKALKETDSDAAQHIIGQFGVGFYSAFMVGDKVEVYTRQHDSETGVYWKSDGLSDYETRLVSNIDHGTKIVIHLKPEHREYATAERVEEVLVKNSAFARYQIRLNNTDIEMKKPIWLMQQRDLDEEKHEEFYKYISSATDGPRWTLHYVSDMPLTIKALFYCPKGRPSMFEVQKLDDDKSNIALYSRNVLIQKNSSLVPRWLRFLRGVVDCEDIPLNLSRELLQDQTLIKKLRQTVTDRIIKWFLEKAKKRPEEYEEFFKDFKLYLVQGILEEQNLTDREKMTGLLRYECSSLPEGQMTSLADYKSRMPSEQPQIVYLYTTSRRQAESSPYYEILKSKGTEVLFCYDTYDDVAMMQLQQFDGKPIASAEAVVSSDGKDSASPDKKDDETDTTTKDATPADNLASWATNELAELVESVSVSSELLEQPAMVTGWNLGYARTMARRAKESQAVSDSNDPMAQMMKMMKPKLVLNPSHPLVLYAASNLDEKPDTSKQIMEHLFNWSMVSAGLEDDTKSVLDKTNTLLLELIK